MRLSPNQGKPLWTYQIVVTPCFTSKFNHLFKKSIFHSIQNPVRPLHKFKSQQLDLSLRKLCDNSISAFKWSSILIILLYTKKMRILMTKQAFWIIPAFNNLSLLKIISKMKMANIVFSTSMLKKSLLIWWHFLILQAKLIRSSIILKVFKSKILIINRWMTIMSGFGLPKFTYRIKSFIKTDQGPSKALKANKINTELKNSLLLTYSSLFTSLTLKFGINTKM